MRPATVPISTTRKAERLDGRTRSFARRLARSAAVVVLGGSGGCGGEQAPQGAPKAAPPARVTQISGYSALCRGAEIEPTAAIKYKKKPGEASPVIALANTGDGRGYAIPPWAAFGDWKADTVEAAELVVCVHGTKRDKLGECTFDGGHVLEQYAFEATVSVFEAKHGQRIDTTTVERNRRGVCPSIWDFPNKGTARSDFYLDGLDVAVAFAVAKHQPDDAPPPQIDARELVDACDGKPTVGASPYRAEQGSEHAFVVFTRVGAQPFRRAHGLSKYKTPAPWAIRNALASSGVSEHVSVAMCMTAERNKKLRDCEFHDGSSVALYDATWDVRLVEAKTGRELAATQVPGEGKCPTNWSSAAGKEYLSPPGDSLSEFFSGIVDPK